MQKYNAPFPHVVLNNFVSNDLIHDIVREYDNILTNRFHEWKTYDNPLEKKHTFNNLQETKYIKKLSEIVADKAFIQSLEETFGIRNIELDTTMYGAGLHNHATDGFLCTHLDYEINPVTHRKRWLNLIIYLNDDWNTDYNGDTELWNENHTTCVKRVYPEFNKALIFRTDNNSWHGVSRKIKCPLDTSRKTIAFYYVSVDEYEITENTRTKARFYHPDHPELCEIRQKRLLTPLDYESIVP